MFVVVNKADNPRLEEESFEFHQLGVENIYPISAEHNRGIQGLLEEVDQLIPLKIKEIEDDNEDLSRSDAPIAVAVIGKPNAGKSSFVSMHFIREGADDCRLPVLRVQPVIRIETRYKRVGFEGRDINAG